MVERAERGRFAKEHQPIGGYFKKGHTPLNKGLKNSLKWETITCVCGMVFDDLRARNREFCSKKCMYENRKSWGNHTEESKRKIGAANKIFYAANPDKIPTWNGGKSFIKYTREFKTELRQAIRRIYAYTCQECERTEEELKYKLSCHHIDYDTQNNEIDNLIPLCRSCHAKTNVNRGWWLAYFTELMEV